MWPALDICEITSYQRHVSGATCMKFLGLSDETVVKIKASPLYGLKFSVMFGAVAYRPRAISPKLLRKLPSSSAPTPSPARTRVAPGSSFKSVHNHHQLRSAHTKDLYPNRCKSGKKCDGLDEPRSKYLSQSSVLMHPYIPK